MIFVNSFAYLFFFRNLVLLICLIVMIFSLCAPSVFAKSIKRPVALQLQRATVGRDGLANPHPGKTMVVARRGIRSPAAPDAELARRATHPPRACQPCATTTTALAGC